MGNKLLLVLAFILTPLIVVADEPYLSFGVTGGINTSNARHINDSRSGTGYNFGVLANYNIAPRGMLRTELNFTSKVYTDTYQYSAYAETMDEKFTLNRLEIPLLFIFKPSYENTGLYFMAGPLIAFDIKSKLVLSYNDRELEYPYDDIWTTVTTGFQYGLGGYFYKGLSAEFILCAINWGEDSSKYDMNLFSTVFRMVYSFTQK